MSHFWLNGVGLAGPTTFKISRYRITKSNRLADGTMSMELIAKKRKFFFTYDSIGTKAKNAILDEIWENDDNFYDFEYEEDGETKSATVYAGEIPTELHQAYENGMWVWKNFNFDLIEK